MPRRFPMAVFAIRSRRAVIRRGIPRRPRLSSIRRFVFRPSSSPIRVRPSIIRFLCCVPWRPSTMLLRRSVITSTRMCSGLFPTLVGSRSISSSTRVCGPFGPIWCWLVARWWATNRPRISSWKTIISGRFPRAWWLSWKTSNTKVWNWVFQWRPATTRWHPISSSWRPSTRRRTWPTTTTSCWWPSWTR